MTDLQTLLFSMRDEEYARFTARLQPTVDPDTILGVRTPQLRSLAKEMAKDGRAEGFLSALPHSFYEENQLHAFLLSGMRDADRCFSLVETFLPFVDNWATSDSLMPKCFQKRRADLLVRIDNWLTSDHTYTLRFAIDQLMSWFLDEDFSPEYPEKVAAIRSEEYYVNMMIAWYFATALAKQYDAVLPYLTEHRLGTWVHNKTIRKAVESFRISPAQKEYLRSLRRK